MPKLFAIDIDGTLTKESCWTEEQCLNATPRQEIIDLVNTLYGKHHIVVWTSRREDLRPATEYWLSKHKVKYHALEMGHKLGADIYLDDKAINSTDKDIVKKIEQALTTLNG